MFNFEEDVQIGEFVLFQSHPGAGVSYPALVAHKANDSIEVVVFAWNGADIKGTHKSGVRHVTHEMFNDPIRVAAVLDDGDSGCFEVHPTRMLVNDLLERIEALEDGRKGGRKPKIKLTVDQAEPPKDLSFRFDEKALPELTPEQKAEKRQLLQEQGA